MRDIKVYGSRAMTFRGENQLCHCVDAQPVTLETSPPAAELLVFAALLPLFSSDLAFCAALLSRRPARRLARTLSCLYTTTRMLSFESVCIRERVCAFVCAHKFSGRSPATLFVSGDGLR